MPVNKHGNILALLQSDSYDPFKSRKYSGNTIYTTNNRDENWMLFFFFFTELLKSVDSEQLW